MSLQKEVQGFRDWASANYLADERYGEWECDFPRWSALYAALETFLAQKPLQEWRRGDTQDLLYLLARDNELEQVIDELSSQPDRLLYLARAALKDGEPDAKWQIASRLGTADIEVGDAELLLLGFLRDPDEYVRRRALLALAETGSDLTETWAEVAWKTRDEYQRIAALHALKRVSSNRLEEYIEKAKQDGREFLVKNAFKLSG